MILHARRGRLAHAVFLTVATALASAGLATASAQMRVPTGAKDAGLSATGSYGPVLLKQVPFNVGVNSIGRLKPAADGSFYAAVPLGGMGWLGSVVHLMPDGTVTEVYASTPQNGSSIGSSFVDVVMGLHGRLYVAAQFTVGGSGSLFELSPDGKRSTVLHSFSLMTNGTNADGALPAALATDTDGSILGVAASGGPAGGGVLFRMSPHGQYSVVHAFSNSADPSAAPEGFDPTIVMLGNDHAVYVATRSGGAHGSGTVSRLDARGVLHTVYSNAANFPISQLVQTRSGTFVGRSGIQYFSLTPKGRYAAIDLDPLYGDPASLSWLITGPDGLAYGTAYTGGALFGGGIFRFNADNSVEALAYPGMQATDIFAISAAGFGSDGNLYGIGKNNVLGTSSFELPLPPPAGWGTGTPPNLSLTATPASVPAGQPTTITWNSSDADQCELYGNANQQFFTTSGSWTLTPLAAGPMTISLGCSNNQGLAASTSVTVTVTAN